MKLLHVFELFLFALIIPVTAQTQVFESVIEKQFPGGYKVVSPDGRVLNQFPPNSKANVKASLLKDGAQVYVSDWGYQRSLQGDAPNLIVAQEENLKRLKEDDVVSASETKVHALLIGNLKYSVNDSSNIADLENTHNDVSLLGQTLTSLGVEVHEIKEATKEKMLSSMKEVCGSMGKSDVLFFYFAGHGVQIDGENYLIPIGANFEDNKIELVESCVPLGEILGEISISGNRLSMVVLDCCRNNPYNSSREAMLASRSLETARSLRSGEGPAQQEDVVAGLGQVFAPKNTLISYATSPGAVAVDSLGRNERNSPFTKALAEALKHDVEVREVFEIAGKQVSQLTGGYQIPWKSNDTFSFFYLHSPTRTLMAPDGYAKMATQLVRLKNINEEVALPESVANLTRSIRLSSEGNPSGVALTFLLTFGNFPIPIAATKLPQDLYFEHFGDLKLSQDFSSIGFSCGVVNREDGAAEIDGELENFVPSYSLGESRVREDEDDEPYVLSRRHWLDREGLCGFPVCISLNTKKFKTIYEERMEEVFPWVPVYLSNPLWARSGLITQDRDYAFFAQNKWVGGSVSSVVSVSEYFLPRPLDYSKSWKLHSEPVYVYGEGFNLLKTGYSGESLFLGPNEMKVLNGAGVAQSVTKSPLTKDEVMQCLGLSVFHEKFALSVLNGETGFSCGRLYWFEFSPLQLIEISSRNRDLNVNFGSASRDGEWLFSYDGENRPTVLDFSSNGVAFELFGSRPFSKELYQMDELNDSSYSHYIQHFEDESILPPPFESWCDEFYSVPAWLPDLAEAVIGFQLDSEGQAIWFDDSYERILAIKERMIDGEGCNESFRKWADWYLEHRINPAIAAKAKYAPR